MRNLFAEKWSIRSAEIYALENCDNIFHDISIQSELNIMFIFHYYYYYYYYHHWQNFNYYLETRDGKDIKTEKQAHKGMEVLH